MIDIDKVKQAFAATPVFCQAAYCGPSTKDAPTALCAISALIVYAGVDVDLLRRLVQSEMPPSERRYGMFYNILRVEYGLHSGMVTDIIRMFDNSANEFQAVVDVLAVMEAANEHERLNPPPTLTLWPIPFGISFSSSSYAFWGVADGKAAKVPLELFSGQAPAGTVPVAQAGDVVDAIAAFNETQGVEVPASLTYDAELGPLVFQPAPGDVLATITSTSELASKTARIKELYAQLVGSLIVEPTP